MELEFDKEDLEKLPVAWSKELVISVTDYIDGKKNSKKRLREFVNREISENYYNQLIERYGGIHRINKDKRERELKRKIKNGICITASIIILLTSLAETLGNIVVRYGNTHALLFFFLWFGAVFYIIEYLSQEDSKMIKAINWENERLKDELADCKHTIRELEAKLEVKNSTYQQEQHTLF